MMNSSHQISMIYSWNCRGLGTTSTVRNLRFQVRKYDPPIVFLSETKMQREKIVKIRRKLGFEHEVYFDPIGRSGGLALWWKENVELNVGVLSKNVIHVDEVVVDGKEFGSVTLVYGPNEITQKQRWWRRLRSLQPPSNVPWAIIGDFNELLYQGDKEGGRTVPFRDLERFRLFMEDCYLLEVETKGSRFTWANMREGEDFIKECLDRAIINTCWASKFSRGLCTVLEAIGSDHSPLLLEFERKESLTPKLFRFDERWLLHPELEEIIRSEWNPQLNEAGLEQFIENLRMITDILERWSKKEFGNSQILIKKLMGQLNACMQKPINDNTAREISELKEKINKAWETEELYWAQKSRVKWLQCGDRNTRYFHMATTLRRKRNRITSLLNQDNVRVENEEEIGDIFKDFYNSLFTSNGSRDFTEILHYVEAEINEQDNNYLLRPVTNEEVKEAVFNLGGSKAPGPDGFTGKFYQKHWHIVGDQVFSLVKDFFCTGFPLHELNKTDMVLIPKTERPNSVNDYRPISLCNFSYKIFSKVLVNRIKPLLRKVILENQRAFVEGRQIQDNIIIVHELFQHLKVKKYRREMAIKVDMNKAYDRIEWDFLIALLLKMGFSKELVDKIFWCISSVEFSIMLSGKRMSQVIPKRGLRQGDPLSPYLFIIVSNVLSKILEKEQQNGLLKGIEVGRGCPPITHVSFADDLVVFLKADMDNCRHFKSVLDLYCMASGQKINFQKSCLYFSAKVPDLIKEEIGHVLQIPAVDIPGNYLGLPITWGRSKVQALNFVIDKVKKKMMGWQRNFLSEAGREVLLKAVINSIPTYPMSCFAFPKSVLNKLDSLITRFWWKGSMDKRKIHWVAKDKLKMHKHEGGLGFKDLAAFNKALLAKLGWRILQEPQQLWVKILKARYFPKTTFMEAKKGSQASWLWNSILEGREILRNNIFISVGNGKNINIWNDPWIRNLPGNKLYSQCPLPELSDLKVADLRNGSHWELSLIDGFIEHDESEAIANTNVTLVDREDKWLWTRGSKNIYSVKEGYKVALHLSHSHNDENIPEASNPFNIWKIIWKLKVPNKIRFFMWRVLSNALPTFDALKRRKCMDNDICSICKNSSESISHVFINCGWAQRVWCGVGFNFSAQNHSPLNIESWLSSVFKDCEKDSYRQGLVAYTLWQIWKARCEAVYENKYPNPMFTFTQAGCLLAEFWEANGWTAETYQREHQNVNDVQNKVWQPPEGDFLKINTDCAFNKNTKKAALSMVIRNKAGMIVDGASKTQSVDSAFMGECLALLWAFQYVQDNNLADVSIESDNKMLIEALNDKQDLVEWNCYAIVENILFIRNLCRIQFCRWIPREANEVAHWIAQASMRGSCPPDWVWRPPPQLQMLLDKDCSAS